MIISKRSLFISFISIMLIGFVGFWGCTDDEDESADTKPPGKPQGVTHTVQDFGEIILNWNPNLEDDFYHYIVYQADTEDGDKTKIKEPETNTTTITGLSVGETHYFWVTAIDVNDNESNFSNTIDVYIPTQEEIEDGAGAAISASMMTNISSTAYSTSKEEAREEIFDNNGCPVIDLEGEIGNRMLIITYQDTCVIDSIPISGVVSGVFEYSIGEGLEINLEMNEFMVNDLTTNGNVIINASILRATELILNGYVLINDSEGNHVSFSAQDLTETAYFNQTIDPYDDYYVLNGYGSYSNVEEQIYTAIFEDVRTEFMCTVPVSGIMTIETIDPDYTIKVDFGDGDCDLDVDVSVGELELSINLLDWLNEYE